MQQLQIEEESYLLSPETISTASSSGEDGLSTFQLQLSKLNAFLVECQIQPLAGPWSMNWSDASARTRRRYTERTSEIISSFLTVVYPKSSVELWNALQSSKAVNRILGSESASLSSEDDYLEALAEAYKSAASWDTRRQVLSVMTGVASYKAIAEHIPGLTQYRYSIANLHRQKYGRAVPVPHQHAQRLRIDKQQLDHFLSFITSPHLVQDLLFGEKSLKLSNGQYVVVPNVIRALIPQRIVKQYVQYCSEINFVPFSERTMLRILSQCSASVRKSLQGLDYFAAEGAKAFDDLCAILESALALEFPRKGWQHCKRL